MANVPFSIRLNEDIKAQLKHEAKLSGKSESSLAVSAIKNYLDIREQKRQAIDEALALADQGDFISSEGVRHWIDSWGSDEEGDIPKSDIHLKP